MLKNGWVSSSDYTYIIRADKDKGKDTGTATSQDLFGLICNSTPEMLAWVVVGPRQVLSTNIYISDSRCSKQTSLCGIQPVA